MPFLSRSFNLRVPATVRVIAAMMNTARRNQTLYRAASSRDVDSRNHTSTKCPLIGCRFQSGIHVLHRFTSKALDQGGTGGETMHHAAWVLAIGPTLVLIHGDRPVRR